MDRHCHTGIRNCARIAAAATLAAYACRVHAVRLEFGDNDEWQLDWDTNVAYTAQWRVAKQDDNQFAYKEVGGNDPIAAFKRHTVLINANDGDNNFNRSLVQNKASFVTEMDLKWHSYGLFTPGPVATTTTSMTSTPTRTRDFLTYNSGNSPAIGGTTGFRRFPDATIDKHRDRLEMLDYFVYASGELAVTTSTTSGWAARSSTGRPPSPLASTVCKTAPISLRATPPASR